MQEQDEPKSGILDAVSISQRKAALRAFNPQTAIFEFLEKLSAREKQILSARYGLESGIPLTLEEIGEKQNLTRERVRQIEKDALKKLDGITAPHQFSDGIDLIFEIIEDQGNIAREDYIFDAILQSGTTNVLRCGIAFMLSMSQKFNLLRASSDFHQSWYLSVFDQKILQSIHQSAVAVLDEAKRAISTEELLGAVQARLASESSENQQISDRALESYISITKKIDRNPFGEWGLTNWPSIRPKDVGDKAYLVLMHLKEPAHYSKITELINKQNFDKKTAQKESVHNELIKDARFVLIGRGIYALREWGYQKGIVADIIADILTKRGQPMSRDEIISEVLKQRQVKRNTIIVGLSNRNRFQKSIDNKYTNAPVKSA